jgi:hypothetical protein
LLIKTNSPYVFAAYNDQLRRCHERKGRPEIAGRVMSDFKPICLGDWFSERLADWSASLAKGHAYPHVFRKTSLQYARIGEDINRQVANDARVGESVMMTSYVKETDEELRQASNRTFGRILASLPPEVAHRNGHTEASSSKLEQQLQAAMAAKNWPQVARLSVQMSRRKRTPTG